MNTLENCAAEGMETIGTNAFRAAMEAQESCMIQEILRWANLFAGESRYNKI